MHERLARAEAKFASWTPEGPETFWDEYEEQVRRVDPELADWCFGKPQPHHLQDHVEFDDEEDEKPGVAFVPSERELDLPAERLKDTRLDVPCREEATAALEFLCGRPGFPRPRSVEHRRIWVYAAQQILASAVARRFITITQAREVVQHNDPDPEVPRPPPNATTKKILAGLCFTGRLELASRNNKSFYRPCKRLMDLPIVRLGRPPR